MASSSKKSFSFRFNKNEDEDSLHNNDEDNIFDDDFFDANLGGNISSNSMKSHSVSSKWLNESWKKFQQIIEDRKEKVNNIKKDSKDATSYQELTNFSNDENGHHENNDQTLNKKEYYAINKDSNDSSCDDDLIYEAEEVLHSYLLLNENETSNSHNSSPTLNEDKKILNAIKKTNLSDKTFITYSDSKNNKDFKKDIKKEAKKEHPIIKNVENEAENKNLFKTDLETNLKKEIKNVSINVNNLKMKKTDDKDLLIQNDDEPLPSLPQAINWLIYWARSRFTFFHISFLFFSIFVLFLTVQVSPLTSFVNGFIIGILFAFLFSLLFLIYILNMVFQKIDKENFLHEKILSGQKWKNFTSFSAEKKDDATIYEGWFFKLVYSKKLGVDQLNLDEKCDYDKMPETKAHLVYVKLEGTIMRLFISNSDQLKKQKNDLDKIHFFKVSTKMTQHIYDFSKMKVKRIHLWLPKNIKNQKKYLWARKYPIILIIEETTNKLNSINKKPFNLILFARTNRDKEEWFNKFRIAIDTAERNLQIHQVSSTSSPEEALHELDKIPRTMSLNIGDLAYNCDFEHLGNYLTYESFINELKETKSNLKNIHDSSPSVSTDLLWFNSLVGRTFLDFLTHSHWTKWVQMKIQRKLSRIKLPYFIQTLILKDVNLGTCVPTFLSVINEPIIDEKGIWIDFDLEYQGGFTMTLETKIDLMRIKDNKASERELKPLKSFTSNLGNNSNTIDLENDDFSDVESIISLSDEDSEENLSIESDSRQTKFVKYLDKIAASKYFQQATDNKFVKRKMEEVSNTPLLLTVTLQELNGILTINIPPPPTDRLWYGFKKNPKLILTAKPALGERVVSITHITQWISKKLKQEFNKLLVVPNMDDLPIQVMMGNDIVIDDVVP